VQKHADSKNLSKAFSIDALEKCIVDLE